MAAAWGGCSSSSISSSSSSSSRPRAAAAKDDHDMGKTMTAAASCGSRPRRQRLLLNIPGSSSMSKCPSAHRPHAEVLCKSAGYIMLKISYFSDQKLLKHGAVICSPTVSCNVACPEPEHGGVAPSSLALLAQRLFGCAHCKEAGGGAHQGARWSQRTEQTGGVRGEGQAGFAQGR